MMIISLVAMTELKKYCITLMHICSGYFTQVSEPWPVGLLFHLETELRMYYYDVITFADIFN